jgi:hypothetical protein
MGEGYAIVVIFLMRKVGNPIVGKGRMCMDVWFGLLHVLLDGTHTYIHVPVILESSSSSSKYTIRRRYDVIRTRYDTIRYDTNKTERKYETPRSTYTGTRLRMNYTPHLSLFVPSS